MCTMAETGTLEQIKKMTSILDELDEFYASNKEREVELLANALTDMVLVLEKDGTIKYANPSSYRVLGYDPAELIGKNVCGLVGENLDIVASVNTTIDINVHNKSGDVQRIFVYIGELKDVNFHLYLTIIKKAQNQ